MTENNDNLIAEARAYVKTYEPRMGAPKLEVTLIDGLLAALDAVQPVTPDKEVLAKALAHAKYGPEVEWDRMEARFQRAMLQQADALLASGVLGQPHPQPDREALIEAGVNALIPADRRDPLMTADKWPLLKRDVSAVLDALLPLLGQPRTDTPLDPERDAANLLADLTEFRDTGHVTRTDRTDHDWPCPLFYTGNWREDRTPTRACTHEKGCPEQDQARYPRTDTEGRR